MKIDKISNGVGTMSIPRVPNRRFGFSWTRSRETVIIPAFLYVYKRHNKILYRFLSFGGGTISALPQGLFKSTKKPAGFFLNRTKLNLISQY